MSDRTDTSKINPDKYNQRFVELLAPCFYCKHRVMIGEQGSNNRWTCKAFPAGVPFGIWNRDINHDVPQPGQVGQYVFESIVEQWPDGKFTVDFFGNWTPVRPVRKRRTP